MQLSFRHTELARTSQRKWTPICIRHGMPDNTPARRPVPVPRPKDAPKRPRVKQRPELIPTTDALDAPEAPLPDRGVAPGITG